MKAVGTEHQNAVGRINERHASGEKGGEYEQGAQRCALEGLSRGYAEERHFGRGVEAETEQKANRDRLDARLSETNPQMNKQPSSLADLLRELRTTARPQEAAPPIQSTTRPK